MSSTRRRSENGPLRQERFASSPSLPKGILGNLVAKRCATLRDTGERNLVHFLHELSLRDGYTLHRTCNLFPAWPWPSSAAAATTERAFERIARELAAMFPERIDGMHVARFCRFLPRYLVKLCLDPSVDLRHARAPHFDGLVEALYEYQRRFQAAVADKIASTTASRTIFEALDYALSQRVMVLVTGTYRIGKSHAAQTFAQMHLGECRYVQLSSAADNTAFYRDVAHALGVACSSQMKAAEIRQRVEEVLRSQHLLLILDEADYIWPQSVRLKAYPERVNWLMTAAINQGVAVALIGSRNFQRMMDHVEKRCPLWGSEQFHGRIKLRRELPDNLDEADLFGIAALLLPEADEPTRMLLVGHAMKSDGYVAALESAATRARFFADREGRPVAFEDVHRVMVECGTDKPSAPPVAPVDVLAQMLSTDARGASAKLPRAVRVLPATNRQPLGALQGVNNFTGSRPLG